MKSKSCLIALAVLLNLGCGGSDGPALEPVTGTVTKGGQPLAGVSVTFSPVDSGPSSAGLTDSSGKFVLLSASGKAGAVAGKHKVVLTKDTASSSGVFNPTEMEASRNAAAAGGRQGRPPGDSIEGESEIPADYSDPTKTPLEYEVKAGSNDFDVPIP